MTSGTIFAGYPVTNRALRNEDVQRLRSSSRCWMNQPAPPVRLGELFRWFSLPVFQGPYLVLKQGVNILLGDFGTFRECIPEQPLMVYCAGSAAGKRDQQYHSFKDLEQRIKPLRTVIPGSVCKLASKYEIAAHDVNLSQVEAAAQNCAHVLNEIRNRCFNSEAL